MNTYITEQGDTWDKISFKVYGSSKYIGLLMESNYNFIDIFIFSAGYEVNIPELSEEQMEDIPEWRK